jgi:hypothetical protein
MKASNGSPDRFPLRNRVFLLPYIMHLERWDFESGCLDGRVATSDPRIICKIESQIVSEYARGWVSLVSDSGQAIRFEYLVICGGGFDAGWASGHRLFVALADYVAEALDVLEDLAHCIVDEERHLTEGEVCTARRWSIENALDERIQYLLMSLY